MRARIIDERVSLITKMTPITNAPVNLTRKIKRSLKHAVWWTHMACTHCTHRHPRCGLAEMSPPNADPRPKENSAENANRDIGNPRLEQCQYWSYYRHLPYSCGCHISAMLPPTNAALHEPKTPCSARATTTVCIFGALPVISACLLLQSHDNLQCVHNLSKKKQSRRYDVNRSSAALLRRRYG
jgi:hypothetical protein